MCEPITSTGDERFESRERLDSVGGEGSLLPLSELFGVPKRSCRSGAEVELARFWFFDNWLWLLKFGLYFYFDKLTSHRHQLKQPLPSADIYLAHPN